MLSLADMIPYNSENIKEEQEFEEERKKIEHILEEL